jgi:nucleotide-binding universal stress UspA family protein
MPFLPKSRVVVPVDFSEGSVDAIKTALDLVSQPAALHLLHILLPLDTLAPGTVWGTLDDGQRLQKSDEHFQEFLKTNGLGDLHGVVRIGDPGWEIAEYARTKQAELIVIPSHGYHGFKRVLLGSVAERVIRHASCPVLVLRRPDAE